MTPAETKAENHTGRWILQHWNRVPRASLLRYMAPIILCVVWAGRPSSSAAQGPAQQANVSSRVIDGDLPQAWPEEVGVNSSDLVHLSHWIREKKLDVRSFLVIKDGKLVFERYAGGLTRDHNYELYSITKGVTSLVAGQLIGDGRVHLDDKVGRVLGTWRPDLAGMFADKWLCYRTSGSPVLPVLSFHFPERRILISLGNPPLRSFATGTAYSSLQSATFCRQFKDVREL